MVADGLAVGLLDLVAHRTRTEGYQKANNAVRRWYEKGPGARREKSDNFGRGGKRGTRRHALVLRVGHRTGDTVIYSLT